ncbi:hypothetical protein COT63_02075 [Candidatus Shapirobacteria bacterium CG09_land_8_20_14_0_10_38_17]|uniref:Uncharacterized protein n=1 Tax=Candidatus Shapirobacteria bacterium CG09_land_8_20_14_0_10_38_17 TaxID=1974884 RepID=A0A2H0WQV9_9BACT|nr:MAG: hypothetical protein COT63_02075 [Candidatus Shapirobacteria bacterium CG09_land_8_20_14_0_10_38_17]
MTFSTRNSEVLGERMRITNTGNVGIGTAGPNSKLDVDGGYLQVYDVDSQPASTDCDAAAEYGRMRVTTGTNRGLEVCLDDGWYHIRPGVNDLAENFPTKDETLEAGEIVAIDKQYSVFVKKAGREDTQLAVGIVSTDPGMLLGQNIQELYPNEHFVPVALAGRVPSKVSTINGLIAIGDPITSSEIPGVGMKATKGGPIVGRALEPYDNPDPKAVGKILVFVNVSWYDPDVFLTDTGNFQIITDSGDSQKPLKEIGQMGPIRLINEIGEEVKRVGAFAEIATAKIKAGLIETTYLITDNLVAKNITSEEKIISPIIETDQLKVKSEKLKVTDQNNQPMAEFNTKTKKTTLFGDLEVAGKTTTAEINAQRGNFGDLLAENVGIGQTLRAETVILGSEATPESRDDAGQASMTLDVRGNASISGTLYADRIIAREGGFGELLAKDVSVESIKTIVKEEILNPRTTRDAGLAQVQDDGNQNGGDEGDRGDMGEEGEEFDLEALLAEVEKWTGTSTKNDLSLECPSEEGKEGEEGKERKENFCLVDTNFVVLGGHTSLGNTSIAGQLSIGSLIIADNSLDTLGDTLYIQKLAMAGLDILSGKITVDVDGNVFIAAHLTAGGGITTSEIKPMGGGDLAINLENKILNQVQDDGGGVQDPSGDQGSEFRVQEESTQGKTGFGKLLVKGIGGETVASVDASGSAKFKEIATDLLKINADNEATQLGAIIASAENLEKIGIQAPGIKTNATAGMATLPASETEIIIYNDKITDQSLVYLTPTSDTGNKILYVKAKVGKKILNQVQDDGSGTVQDDGSGTVQDDGSGTVQDDGSGTVQDDGNIIEKESYFVVGMNGTLTVPVEFNWWIIN